MHIPVCTHSLATCLQAHSTPLIHDKFTTESLVWCAGCTLPVEMFFPEKEYPTPGMEAALSELGVVCRRLPDMRPDNLDQPDASQASLSGFTMKIEALILSRFREVCHKLTPPDILRRPFFAFVV